MYNNILIIKITRMLKETNTKTKFRLSAKSLFLTYSKCDLNLEITLDIIKTKLSNYIVNEYILVREYHDDGTPHIHGYFKVLKQFNTYNPNYLDLSIDNGIIYHGKYESAKYPNKVIEYLLKCIQDKNDPNLLFSCNMTHRIDILGTLLTFSEAVMRLAENGKINDALALYRAERPEQYLKSHTTIEKSLRSLHLKNSGFITKYNFNDFIIPEEFKTILDNYDKAKTLVLIGESGTGKSQLICAFLTQVLNLNPFVINNIDSIRFFKNNFHNAIVFDDCKWDPNIDRESLIKLVDSESPTTHNVKHGSTVIEYPTLRVIIINSLIP